MQGDVWTYCSALPHGWYPFGVPPDRGTHTRTANTEWHGKSSNEKNAKIKLAIKEKPYRGNDEGNGVAETRPTVWCNINGYRLVSKRRMALGPKRYAEKCNAIGAPEGAPKGAARRLGERVRGSRRHGLLERNIRPSARYSAACEQCGDMRHQLQQSVMPENATTTAHAARH
jgi:hypothetical protein